MLLVIALLTIPPLALAWLVWSRQRRPKLGNAEAVPHSTQHEIDKSIVRSIGSPPF